MMKANNYDENKVSLQNEAFDKNIFRHENLNSHSVAATLIV